MIVRKAKWRVFIARKARPLAIFRIRVASAEPVLFGRSTLFPKDIFVSMEQRNRLYIY